MDVAYKITVFTCDTNLNGLTYSWEMGPKLTTNQDLDQNGGKGVPMRAPSGQKSVPMGGQEGSKKCFCHLRTNLLILDSIMEI